MDRNSILVALSRISRKKPEEIQSHISLASLGVTSSFGLGALRSMLEAQGNSKLPILKANMKVGDVIQLLTDSVQAPTPKTNSLPALKIVASDRRGASANGLELQLPAGITLGMDMQEIASLPIATDYRTHEFYASHFCPKEIATSLLRPDPRAHLCGIFCAKEAAKKSRPDLLNLRINDFFVFHDPAGRPAMQLIDGHELKTRYRFLISITHTKELAAATCLTLDSGVVAK
jgi:holo-[acyl-carrier protein] synthase